MIFSSLQFVILFLIALGNYYCLIKKQKSFVKRIHLVTDDSLYDRKAFYKVKIVFDSSSKNDGEFINHPSVYSPFSKASVISRES